MSHAQQVTAPGLSYPLYSSESRSERNLLIYTSNTFLQRATKSANALIHVRVQLEQLSFAAESRRPRHVNETESTPGVLHQPGTRFRRLMTSWTLNITNEVVVSTHNLPTGPPVG